MSGYQPVGGWSGQIVADAPPAAPLLADGDAVSSVPEPEPVPVPSFGRLASAFFVADFVIEVVGLVMIMYLFTLFIALDASFGANEVAGGSWSDKAAIFGLNLVWTLVSIPMTRAVLRMVLGVEALLYPLAVALLLGLGLRFGLEAVGAPRLVAVLMCIPVQTALMLSIPDSFRRIYSAR